MAGEAIIPGAAEIAPRHHEPAATPELEESNREERIIASLAQHPGWALFREAVLKECSALETLKGQDLSQKTTVQIGELFLIGRKAAEKLRETLKTVEVVAQVVTQQQQEKK